MAGALRAVSMAGAPRVSFAGTGVLGRRGTGDPEELDAALGGGSQKPGMGLKRGSMRRIAFMDDTQSDSDEAGAADDARELPGTAQVGERVLTGGITGGGVPAGTCQHVPLSKPAPS